jgi:hypothetical protein
MAIYKSKRGDKTRIPGYDVAFYDVSYSASEDIGTTPLTEIDFGTVSIAAGDEESAEKCIILKTVANKAKINGLKYYMIKGSLPGVKVVSDGSLAALVAALATAGTPAAYTTEMAGNLVDADSLTFDTVTTGESNRLRMQLQITQSEFTTALPYTPGSELNEYYGEVFFYYFDSDYVIRFDSVQAPFSSKLLSELSSVAAFIIDDNGVAISLGYLEPGASINRTHNTITSMKGNPKTTTEEIIESTDNSISFTLQVEDWAISNIFDNNTFAYDATSGMFKADVNDDTLDVVERRLQLVGFTSGGYMRVYDFPRAKLKRAGEKSINMTDTTVPFECMPVAESDGTNYKIYQSTNEAHLISIPYKMAVTVV